MGDWRKQVGEESGNTGIVENHPLEGIGLTSPSPVQSTGEGKVATAEVLRAQGADPETVKRRSPKVYEAAEAAVELGRSLIMPRRVMARYRVARVGHDRLVLENGHRLSGALIGTLLSPSNEVVVVICTIGSALEERVRDLIPEDPALALSLDAYGSLAVERMVTDTCNTIGNELEDQKLSMPVFPGYEGWPLAEGQGQLFSLIDASETGVRLTGSAGLVPHKSVSFVLGIGPSFEEGGVPCTYCGVRETCDHRHAA